MTCSAIKMTYLYKYIHSSTSTSFSMNRSNSLTLQNKTVTQTHSTCWLLSSCERSRRDLKENFLQQDFLQKVMESPDYHVEINDLRPTAVMHTCTHGLMWCEPWSGSVTFDPSLTLCTCTSATHAFKREIHVQHSRCRHSSLSETSAKVHLRKKG